MASSDSIFPSGVIDAPGSPHFIPDASMGPPRTRRWAHREQSMRPAWETEQENRHRIAEIVSGGVGNPLLPGSKGNFTVRAKGILVNLPTTDPDTDQGEGTDEIVDDTYTPSSNGREVAVNAVVRSGQALSPDEVVEHDPFGGAGRAVVEARSGNEDPDGDTFTRIGAGSPRKRGLGEVAAGQAPVNWIHVAGFALLAGICLLYLKKR